MTGEAKESAGNSGSEVSFAHLGTYEDMLVANNTDLNHRSTTTSLVGT